MGSIITKQTNLRKPTTTTKGSKSSSAWSSPRTHSKQLLKLLSDKAYLAVAGKKKTTDEDPYEQVEEVEGLKEEEEEEREGVWKKSILMGESVSPSTTPASSTTTTRPPPLARAAQVPTCESFPRQKRGLLVFGPSDGESDG
ncbi:hypothetical protein QJS10_CPB12g00275 [Acorus calamus]|uniref:Uncharacterized protein n=1 Tax=Acorus calamus TaxID=4465 RepID=A0AAV9DNY5_ACOCL|nr:hypothetical protein QJS10_CPB12g00275 [Acorus calamus]